MFTRGMFMKPPRRRNPVAVALYVNAALLLAVLAVLLARSDAPTLTLTPAALAQAQQPIAGGAGLFIVPGQFSSNIWGLYLMDVDQQTLCAYTVTGSPPQLKLVAARNFRYDRRLGNYNVAGLTPAEVKDMVEKEQNSNRVTGNGSNAQQGSPTIPQ
jgi:hypothetical protein